MPSVVSWPGARFRKFKPGIRRPRFVRPYPRRPTTGIRRFRGGIVRWEYLRQDRPRRYARPQWGTRTRIDAQAALEARAAQGIDGSLEERIVYAALVQHGLKPDVDFTFQSSEFGGRAVLGGLVADFLFDVPKVVLQVQSYWHTLTREIERRDDDQAALLQAMGYVVLELWPDVIHSQAALDLWITNHLGLLWGTSYHGYVATGERNQPFEETSGMYDQLVRRINELEETVLGYSKQDEILGARIGEIKTAFMQADDDHNTRIARLEAVLFSPGSGGASIRITSAAIANVLQSTNFVSGSSGWRIERTGNIEINNLTARGSMQSNNYVSGLSGWRIDQTGDAEFHDVTVRGELIATAFKYDAVSAMGGSLLVCPASTLAADLNAIQVTVTVTDAQFQNEDYLYIKMGGSYEVMQVVSGGGTVNLVVTRGVGGTAQAWYEGTAVINYKDRIHLTTTASNSPYIDIITRNPDGGSAGWYTRTDTDTIGAVNTKTYIRFLGDRSTATLPLYDMQEITKVRAVQWYAGSGTIRMGIYRLAKGASQFTNAVLLAQGTAAYDGTPGQIVDITLDTAVQVDLINYDYALAYQCSDVATWGALTPGYHWTVDVPYSSGLPDPFGTAATQAKEPEAGLFWVLPYYGERTKVRLGNLSGITDPFLTPTGFGLFCDNTFVRGTAVFGATGDVTLDDDGLTITGGMGDVNSIKWMSDTDLAGYIRGYVSLGDRSIDLRTHYAADNYDSTLTLGVVAQAGKLGSPKITLSGTQNYDAYIDFSADTGGVGHADGYSFRLKLGSLLVYPPLHLSAKSGYPADPPASAVALFGFNDYTLKTKDSTGTVRTVLTSPALGDWDIDGYKLVLDADGDSYIVELGDDIIYHSTGGAMRMNVSNNGLTLQYGTNINEFSTDGTLSGNSDNAVPTEKAVKTYVDASAPTMPYAHVYRTAAYTYTCNTQIAFNAEISDSWGLHSTSSNQGQFKISASAGAGFYLVHLEIQNASWSTGEYYTQCYIQDPSGQAVSAHMAYRGNSGAANCNTTVLLYLNVNDTVTALANVGTSSTFTMAAYPRTHFSIVKVA